MTFSSDILFKVVGTLFFDIGDIYCFGTGLLILMAKDVYQYRHFK